MSISEIDNQDNGFDPWDTDELQRQRAARAAVLAIPLFPELQNRLTGFLGPTAERDIIHQIVFWLGREAMQDRWTTYISYRQWHEQRRLTRKQVTRGRSRLRPWEVVQESIGFESWIHYRVNWVRLAELVDVHFDAEKTPAHPKGGTPPHVPAKGGTPPADTPKGDTSPHVPPTSGYKRDDDPHANGANGHHEDRDRGVHPTKTYPESSSDSSSDNSPRVENIEVSVEGSDVDNDTSYESDTGPRKNGGVKKVSKEDRERASIVALKVQVGDSETTPLVGKVLAGEANIGNIADYLRGLDNMPVPENDRVFVRAIHDGLDRRREYLESKPGWSKMSEVGR